MIEVGLRVLISAALGAFGVFALALPASAAASGDGDPRTNPDSRAIDSDGDHIPDWIEALIADGSPTAATGLEDADGDGLPDWVELAASNGRCDTCVDPRADEDGDKVPDFAELIVSHGESATSVTPWQKSDPSASVPDWVSVVICGYVGCPEAATADLDGDGVPDAAALLACLKSPSPEPSASQSGSPSPSASGSGGPTVEPSSNPGSSGSPTPTTGDPGGGGSGASTGGTPRGDGSGPSIGGLPITGATGVGAGLVMAVALTAGGLVLWRRSRSALTQDSSDSDGAR